MQGERITIGQFRLSQFRSVGVAIALLILVGGSLPSQAQAPLTNPLDITQPDPILLQFPGDRPLTASEQTVLQTELDELQAQAAARLAAGNSDEAFEIWIRELRLRRALGPQAEVAALGRVGAIAWEENRTLEVRAITQRLQTIEQEIEAQPPIDFDLLRQIAEAYQQMRAIAPAVATYDRILLEARQQQNAALEQSTLITIGELHLAWFDYANAAIVYQDLLAIAQASGNRPQEIEYLQRLSYIYQEGKRPQQAVEVQQQLLEIYESRQATELIPGLRIAIADSYRALNRPDLAAVNYQRAFAMARTAQQFAYASEALQKLADLYQELDRLEDALVVYRLIVDIEQQAYSLYGMMDAYDQLGQIHRVRNEQTLALEAFQRGLELAQQLSHKQNYFARQIEALNQPPDQSTPDENLPEAAPPDETLLDQIPLDQIPLDRIPLDRIPLDQIPLDPDLLDGTF